MRFFLVDFVKISSFQRLYTILVNCKLQFGACVAAASNQKYVPYGRNPPVSER